jgi:hypothetical protein
MSNFSLPDELEFFGESLETLKKRFPLKEISEKIASAMPAEFEFEGLLSWEDFESKRKMLLFLAIYKKRMDEDYFLSPRTEALYKLAELQGEEQQKALGVELSLYKSKAKANAWFRKLSLLVHPDRSNHRSAERAFAELNRIHEEMLKNGR